MRFSRLTEIIVKYKVSSVTSSRIYFRLLAWLNGYKHLNILTSRKIHLNLTKVVNKIFCFILLFRNFALFKFALSFGTYYWKKKLFFIFIFWAPLVAQLVKNLYSIVSNKNKTVFPHNFKHYFTRISKF